MKKKKPEITLCQVCKAMKMDVQRVQLGPDAVSACPECKVDLNNTTTCLRVTCDWMMKRFDTHRRTLKPYVLKPYDTESYGLKSDSKRNRSKSICINELQKTPTPHGYPSMGLVSVKSTSPTENTKVEVFDGK